MATRCHIGFYEEGEKDLKNFEALVYRHWDGYPDSVMPDIMPILGDFDKNRGMYDLEYASAWLVAKLKEDYLNIGISKDFHGDIEYVYKVMPSRCEIYKVIDFEGRWNGKDINECVEKIGEEIIISPNDGSGA